MDDEDGREERGKKREDGRWKLMAADKGEVRGVRGVCVGCLLAPSVQVDERVTLLPSKRVETFYVAAGWRVRDNDWGGRGRSQLGLWRMQ